MGTMSWLESLKEKDHSVEIEVDSKIILKLILEKYAAECGLDSCGLGQGTVSGSCERGNEPSGTIKEGNLPDNLKDYDVITQNSRNTFQLTFAVRTKKKDVTCNNKFVPENNKISKAMK
jgi:hypothetical protein